MCKKLSVNNNLHKQKLKIEDKKNVVKNSLILCLKNTVRIVIIKNKIKLKATKISKCSFIFINPKFWKKLKKIITIWNCNTAFILFNNFNILKSYIKDFNLI
jgi:hypothetical protein